ncbi:MAG TPA: response regulator [Candidatus Dormibacteraeota bacterium]
MDDDQIVVDMYRFVLDRAGYRVVVASDGLAGLEVAASIRPSLIFLDIKMPKLDGIEVLRRLKADPTMRSIPVVMLSNYDEPAFLSQSKILGASDYVIKAATDPAELSDVAARYLGSPI